MKVLAILAGGIAATATAALALGIFSSGKEGAPGFLGLGGVLIADVNLVLELLLVLGLTFGAYLARSGKIEAHRINQTIWVLVNAALVMFIMVSSMQDVKLKSVADLASVKVLITWLHALAGTFTVAAGLWLVLQMNDILPRRLHISWWKNLMRATLAGYWMVALGGFVTYYLWYSV